MVEQGEGIKERESGVFRKVIKKAAICNQVDGMDRLIRGQKRKTLKPETSWGKPGQEEDRQDEEEKRDRITWGVQGEMWA